MKWRIFLYTSAEILINHSQSNQNNKIRIDPLIELDRI